MKLEVGQKIWIYEALTNGFFSYNPLLIGSNYLGTETDKNFGIFLLDNQNDCRFMTHNEVRKVSSLIVKRLK